MAKKELPTLKDVSRVPEELKPVVDWWQDHGPKTLTWVVAAVAVCAAAYLWHAKATSADANAVVALAGASQTDEFEAIAALGTDAAPLARLDLAHGLYASGDYENALAVYEAGLGEIDDPALKDIAAVGRVCTLEALGRLDEALAAANELEAAFANASRPHYLASELTLAKVRILCQQGDKAAAQKALEPLLNAPEGSPLAKYKAQAERTAKIVAAYEKKDLFAQAADLAKPAAPAADKAEAPAPVAPAAPAPKAEPPAPAK